MVQVGKRDIFPSSRLGTRVVWFHGYGKPDVFVTMTCDSTLNKGYTREDKSPFKTVRYWRSRLAAKVLGTLQKIGASGCWVNYLLGSTWWSSRKVAFFTPIFYSSCQKMTNHADSRYSINWCQLNLLTLKILLLLTKPSSPTRCLVHVS